MWWQIKTWWQDWREWNRLRCRVDEEWCGIFIGRRYCATHGVRWDAGGDCPQRVV